MFMFLTSMQNTLENVDNFYFLRKLYVIELFYRFYQIDHQIFCSCHISLIATVYDKLVYLSTQTFPHLFILSICPNVTGSLCWRITKWKRRVPTQIWFRILEWLNLYWKVKFVADAKNKYKKLVFNSNSIRSSLYLTLNVLSEANMIRILTKKISTPALFLSLGYVGFKVWNVHWERINLSHAEFKTWKPMYSRLISTSKNEYPFRNQHIRISISCRVRLKSVVANVYL